MIESRRDRLAPPFGGAYVTGMQLSNAKVLTLALAALLAMGTLDAASARQKKKPRPARPAITSTHHVPGTLVPVDRDGTPIIMQGYHSPAMMRDDGEPARRADRPVKIRAAAAPTFRRPIRRPIPSTARRPRR